MLGRNIRIRDLAGGLGSWISSLGAQGGGGGAAPQGPGGSPGHPGPGPGVSQQSCYMETVITGRYKCVEVGLLKPSKSLDICYKMKQTCICLTDYGVMGDNGYIDLNEVRSMRVQQDCNADGSKGFNFHKKIKQGSCGGQTQGVSEHGIYTRDCDLKFEKEYGELIPLSELYDLDNFDGAPPMSDQSCEGPPADCLAGATQTPQSGGMTPCSDLDNCLYSGEVQSLKDCNAKISKSTNDAGEPIMAVICDEECQECMAEKVCPTCPPTFEGSNEDDGNSAAMNRAMDILGSWSEDQHSCEDGKIPAEVPPANPCNSNETD